MHTTRIGVTLIVTGCVASLWGCSESSDACVRRSDCPAGQTCSDGRCLPELKGDSSPAPDGPRVDTLPDAVVWPDTGPVDGGCTANHNGMIERQELVLVVPTTLMYIMGTQLPLNLKGATSGGKTVWDFTAAASDDHDEPMKLEPVPAWAAASFPSATYVSLADKDADTYGVYLVNQTRMQLLGAISGVKDHGKVSYSTPVDLLRFPVQPTDSYSTKTFGTGFWGIAVISNWESWDAEVVGAGVVQLPKLSLDSVMVRIRSQQYLYGNPFLLTTTTLFLFISECYGTVARVVVDGDPANLSQVTARERWRLTTP